MALKSATELITRYYSNDKLAQCCFKVRPTSATLADIKPTFGECAVLAGKALTVNMLWVNCFETPMVTQPFVSQHKAHIRELVNYFLTDVAQVYIEFIWFGNLLLMRLCVWNAYTIIILADKCGCGVICHCGMSRGHCCILGTPLSSVFWQLTIPLMDHFETQRFTAEQTK